MKLDSTIHPSVYNNEINGTVNEVEKDLTEQFNEEEKPEKEKSYKRGAAIAGAAAVGVAGAGAIYAATNGQPAEEEEIEEIVFEEDETPAARHTAPQQQPHTDGPLDEDLDEEPVPTANDKTDADANEEELQAIQDVRGSDETPEQPIEEEPVAVNINDITGDIDPNQAVGTIVEGEQVDEPLDNENEIIIGDQFIDDEVNTTEIIEAEAEDVVDCPDDVIADDPFIGDL
ncbi:MAG: hypothetical protein ACI31C_00560 [Muribaculaceae bacterium]